MHLSKILLIGFLSTLLLMFSFSVRAEVKVSPELRNAMTKNLQLANPKFEIESIQDSGMPGIYRVSIASGPKVYVSSDGAFFFTGDLYSMGTGELINLTELDATKDRKVLMKELNPEEMIIFSPKAPVKTKAVVHVFTDVDCYYCQKLHKEVPEMNARGIEIRYMAYPRAGINSESYKKIVSAWCAADQRDAITKLKNKQAIPENLCASPVEKQFDLGRRMGITGTPAMILEDGALIPGYQPAADLARNLGI